MHYLDNAATTVVNPEVIGTISAVMEQYFANPSSLYKPGMEAEDLIWESRLVVANAMGFAGGMDKTRPEIIFTGSGSEANNIAILGTARARRGWGSHIVATGYEHPSVSGPLEILQSEGFTVDFVNPGTDGTVDIGQIVKLVGKTTILVCAMQVNNETGAVIDLNSLCGQVKKINPRTAVHADGVQGFCKMPPLDLSRLDSYAVSGHKLHAPKGIGALYLRRNLQPATVLAGGGQEGGVRPGTENTPYISGFAKAVELAKKDFEQEQKTIEQLYSRLCGKLSGMEGLVLNSPKNGYHGIINFSMMNGIRSETMLHFLEQREIYVSSGSACSGGSPSHSLTAMGLDRKRIDSALRVSLCGQNTPEDIDVLAAALSEGIASLSRSSWGARR